MVRLRQAARHERGGSGSGWMKGRAAAARVEAEGKLL